jgi:hypothetical protein
VENMFGRLWIQDVVEEKVLVANFQVSFLCALDHARRNV